MYKAIIENVVDQYNLYIEEDGKTVFTSFGLDKAPLVDIEDGENKISLLYELKVDELKII